MSSDFARTNLVTNFVCANCGDFLTMRFGPVETKQPGGLSAITRDNDLTGGTVKVQTVEVNPCPRCIEREVAPARNLAKAIEAFAEKGR